MTNITYKMLFSSRNGILCFLFAVLSNLFSGVNSQAGCEDGKFGKNCQLECHCFGSEICSSNGTCNTCDSKWDGPTCQLELENIALNKQTEQGPNTKKGGESNLAVDGNFKTQSWVQNSDENGTVYWYVDLDQVRKIKKITVSFYDPDPEDVSVEKRRPGWSLVLSNSTSVNISTPTPCYKDTSAFPAKPVVSVTDCVSPARYVYIFNSRLPVDDSLSKLPNLELSEVQVFSELGCSDGTYGDHCERECGHCETISCNRVSGVCQGACLPDYYGDNCNLSCPSICKNDVCAKKDGKCEACNDGYYGNHCEFNCPSNCAAPTCLQTGECYSCKDNNFHTLFCNVSCNTNCKDGCEQSNGNCMQGCNANFYGPKCQLPCDNCLSSCQQDTGVCANDGCLPGFHGDMCELECAVGCVVGEGCVRTTGKCGHCDDTNYGDLCEDVCNANCIDGRCSRNGTCLNGCEDKHFHGDMCDRNCSNTISNCLQCDMVAGNVICSKCTNSKYGAQCENVCPQNCERCTSFSECTHCVPGYSGNVCTDECKVVHCKRCNTSGKCQQCEDGYFGDNCEFQCNENCQTCEAKVPGSNQSTCITCKTGHFILADICNKCIGKCRACHSVSNCTECEPGFHGRQCNLICPENCKECTSKDTCTKCKDGWSGNQCQCTHNCYRKGELDSWCYENGTCAEGCIDGKMGDTCNFNCSINGKCLACHQNTGKCEKCVNGFYDGLNSCDKKCGNCLPDASGDVKCDIETGFCIRPCEDGYYGKKCEEICNKNCLDYSTDTHRCEQSTGQCIGCRDGYFGMKCEQECSANCLDPNTNTHVCEKNTGNCLRCKYGFYGEKCMENCSSNCEIFSGENACEKDSGKCIRCKQRYYGDFCDKQCGNYCESDCNQDNGICDDCKSNRYGDYCNRTCSPNCGVLPFSTSKKIVCHRTLGECLHCKFGYHGEFCDKNCPGNCKKSIVTGNKPICEKAGGACKNCQIGFYGTYCDEVCSRNCGRQGNSGNGSCDQQLGHCNLGCVPGWHNSTCEMACNSSCKDHTCHRQTAACLLGCEEGFEGVFCEKRKVGSASIPLVLGIVIPLAIVVFVCIVFFMLRRKKAKGKEAKNGANLKRPEEINPLLNGNNSFPLTRSSRPGGMAEDDVIDENETAPVPIVRSDPSDYYNSSTSIPVSGFTEYLQNRKRENTDWYKLDFNKLPKGLLKSCDVATNIANRGKCRYKQLYPYDETRVKLKPEGDEQLDFINASYINGYKKKKAFIAAQGPTENTVNDFWRMIFQKDCGKVVMLTNLFEECKMKCARYWPEADEPQTYGIYEVNMVSESELPNYTIRHLQATNGITKEIKDFQHLHFTAWPDRGVPDNPSVMLNFRDKVMVEDSHHLDGPILVHCSAGIGRTGTFVALDFLLKQAHVEPHIDVFKTVCDMRYQRTNFVQTDIQYEFVHNAISEALNTKECEVTDDQFIQHYWSMLESCSEYEDKTKLQDQFEMLLQMSPILDESCFTVGRLEENITKNRYPEILPLDSNRAYLSTPVKGSNEYINAVFLPTCTNKTGFLITQMPLPTTVTDFWRLVYDQHVTNIVMLNNVDEYNDSIGEYWPSDDSTYGPFRVEMISCDNGEDFSVMTIQLTHSSMHKQTRMKVKLFRYEGWADGATLPYTTTSLTSLISQVSRSSRDSKNEPIIVHCLDGAERSGLYCCVASVLERLQLEKKINIPQTVLQLRARRPQLINSFEQFDFCYRAVMDYLENTQIYSNVL